MWRINLSSTKMLETIVVETIVVEASSKAIIGDTTLFTATTSLLKPAALYRLADSNCV